MLVRVFLAFQAIMLLMSVAPGDEPKQCLVTEGGLDDIEVAIEKAASCEKSMETFQACAFAASGDVQLGEAVIRKCESDFLNKLSGSEERTYHQKLKRCWQKYRRESGSLYRSFEAMCAAGVAQAYSRRFSKAGDRKRPDK